MTPEYSIVIACYNSSKWLSDLVAEVEAAMADCRDTFELVLVNDASPDGKTWPVIAELAADRPWIRGLDLQFNVGQFMALMAGLDVAKGAYIITMDDDLQHSPAELPKLIRAMGEIPDTDVVMGRFPTKEHDLYRNLGSSLMNAIYAFTHDRPKHLKLTSFRIMRREIVETILRHRTARPVFGALLLQSTKKIASIEVEHHPRPHGKSGYTLIRLINATLDHIVYSSAGPLRLLGLTGVGISSIAGLLGLYYFTRWLVGSSGALGFTTLVLLVLFFGGMLLFSIGLVGEYVARVLKEVAGNPRYVVRHAVNLSDVKPLKQQNVGQARK